VSRGYLKSIKIPLPPIQNQQHIIDHIQSIQAMAKQLQKEVGEILEKAKKEMEKEIEKAEN
jgi:restriction endonuclease S subunit